MKKSKIENLESKIPKGSVLVFCLVILCLLAMLGMTFLLTVRQASRASLNALGPLQADLAAQAGLNQAQAILRSAFVQQIVGSPATVTQQTVTIQDGVFTQTNPYRYTNGDADEQGPFFVSYFRQFAGGTGPTDSALLYVDPLDTAHKSYCHYTNTPLRVSPQTNTQFFTNPPMPLTDQAYGWQVQGSTNDFYPSTTQPNFKVLARLGSVRGFYYVWIDDLDAKLNVMPGTWGIDTANVPGIVAGVTDNAAVQRAILKNLNAFLYSQSTQCQTMSYLQQDQPTDLYKDLDYIMKPLTQPYVSIDDFALNLPSLVGFMNQYQQATPPAGDKYATDYEDLRTTVNYYFKAGRLNDAQGTPFSGTLNINTAPVEVIEAALSQIPAYDESNPQTPDPAYTFGAKKDASDPPLSLARRLALRIVAKRPFMCRMDFEDFAAAQLPGDINDPTYNTPRSAIYFAILKRGRDPTQPNSPIELDLYRYLEMPGCFPGVAAYAQYAPFLMPAKMQERFAFFANDSGVNLAAYPGASHDKTILAIKEFNNLLNSVFKGPGKNAPILGLQTDGTLASGDDRQITPLGEKGVLVIHPGYDGVLSASVQNALGGDDVLGDIIVPAAPGSALQTTPVAPDQLVTEALPCISAGPNGILDTQQAGDDMLVGSIILPGPNGILDSAPAGDDLITYIPYSYITAGDYTTGKLKTSATGGDQKLSNVAVYSGLNGVAETSIFGFSYYSHDSTAQNYMPKSVDPAVAGKFIYSNATTEGFSTTNPGKTDGTSVCNYLIGDLTRWSCVGNGYRSGFYDMFFNPGDVMRMFLGEVHDPQPPPTNPPPSQRVCVESEVGTKKLHTGWGVAGTPPPGNDDVYGTAPTNHDVQEVTPPNLAGAETIIISPDPNGALQTQPTAPDITVQAILVNDITITTAASDDRWGVGANSGVAFILPGPNGVLETRLGAGDKQVQVIVGGGGYDVTGNPILVPSQTSVPTKEVIQIGANKTNSTSVWGPVRASQRPTGTPDPSATWLNDQKVPKRPQDTTTDPTIVLNPDQIPSAIQPGMPPLSLSDPNFDGDVAWSPQITFRSRFFGIYVLGRGMARLWNSPPGRTPPGETPDDGLTLLQNLKCVGERRLEAVYDALKDEILWQRGPATEKRSLADP